MYLQNPKLNVQILGRGFAWLDTGTFESLIDAGNFVEVIQKRQGDKIACLEEIAFKNDWLTRGDLKEIVLGYKNKDYGKYSMKLIAEI